MPNSTTMQKIDPMTKQHEEARQDFKQEALDSWHDYEENGLHLSGEETKAWLAGWGTASETAIPKCHKSSSPRRSL